MNMMEYLRLHFKKERINEDWNFDGDRIAQLPADRHRPLSEATPYFPIKRRERRKNK